MQSKALSHSPKSGNPTGPESRARKPTTARKARKRDAGTLATARRNRIASRRRDDRGVPAVRHGRILEHRRVLRRSVDFVRRRNPARRPRYGLLLRNKAASKRSAKLAV